MQLVVSSNGIFVSNGLKPYDQSSSSSYKSGTEDNIFRNFELSILLKGLK